MIVFARTRHIYGSYTDFWRLVETSQFETCYVDEIDVSKPDTFIFTPMNGEVVPHLRSEVAQKTKRAKVIWWNLERPVGDPTHSKSLEELKHLIDDIWVSDKWCASKEPRYRFVMMAGHRDFGTRSPTKHYDFCHLSYLWGRRFDVVNGLIASGLKAAPEAYGREAQDQHVATSKIMLNLHQYEESKIAAPLRFAVAASYGIPIISEALSESPWIHGVEDFVWGMAPIEHIPLSLRMALTEDHREEQGEEIFQTLCEQTDFRKEVEKALR